MLRRIEADEPLVERASVGSPAAREARLAPSLDLEAERELGLLPRGHPKWVRDGVAISQRARDVLARLRPIVVRVIRFWDHRVRSIVVGGRRVHVDPSGSYRVE